MIKILYLVDGYPSRDSYANIFIKNQITLIREAGFNVGVLIIDIRSIRKIRRFGFYKEISEGIPLYKLSIPWGPLFKILGQNIANYLALKLFKKVLSDFGQPDIIHSHFGEMGILGAALKLKYNIPLIITEHGSIMLPSKYSHKRKQRVVRKAYRFCDKLIAVSDYLAKHIKSPSIPEVIVIPNFIPNYFFVDASFKSVNKNKRVISVGNLQKNKRFDMTISVFARICERVNDISLIIIGKGPCYNELVKLTKEKKIDDKVFFYQHVPNTEMPKYYRESLCFILLSEYETFGVSIAEALACGIPAIATKCGGPEEIITSDNGLLVPVNDEQAAYEAILNMYYNHGKYNPHMLSADIRARFGQDNFLSKITEVYHSILKK